MPFIVARPVPMSITGTVLRVLITWIYLWPTCSQESRLTFELIWYSLINKQNRNQAIRSLLAYAHYADYSMKLWNRQRTTSITYPSLGSASFPAWQFSQSPAWGKCETSPWTKECRGFRRRGENKENKTSRDFHPLRSFPLSPTFMLLHPFSKQTRPLSRM